MCILTKNVKKQKGIHRMELEKKLQEIVKRNNILKNEPMSKHTSLKIGGIADYFIKVKTVDELKSKKRFVQGSPVTKPLVLVTVWKSLEA